MAEDDDLYYQQHLIDPVVVIRESPIFAKDDRLVFPPVNHENLQLASSVSEFDNPYLESPSSESESPSSSSRGSASSSSFSLSPSDSDGQPPLSPCEFYQKLPSETTEEKCSESPPLTGLKRGGESPPPRKVLYREAHVLQHWWELLLVRAYSKIKILMTWFSTTLRPFYPVLAIAIWWWMRRRRRVNGESRDLLRGAIKERDERIVQLLQQIAQMNELLIKHHKEIVSRR